MIQGRFKNVLMDLLVCFDRPFRVFQGSFKSFSKKLKVCFKKVQKVFLGSFRVYFETVSRKFQSSCNGVLMMY